MTETREVQPPGANVPGYLLPVSILATLLCLPVGILGIIFSVQARSKSREGNYAGASQAVRRANIALIVSVVLGLLSIALIFAIGLLGVLVPLVAGEGDKNDVALNDLVQEQAGVFMLQGVEEYPEGIQLGAEDALTATYEGPGATSLTNNLFDMPSSDAAEQLRQQRLQEQQVNSGLRVTNEESVENDEGEQLGTKTVLAGGAAGSNTTAVLWTNQDLYSEALSESADVEDFYEAVEY